MKRRFMSVAVALALSTAASPLIAEDAALARARALLEKVPLVDDHNDLQGLRPVLERLHPSGLPNPARTQLEQIELARRMIDAYPDTFLFATRAADVERARQQGKIVSFLGMENGQALENSLGACAPTLRSASAT